MKLHDRFIVVGQDLTHLGYAVAKINNFSIFVKDLLVNEEAEIEITQLNPRFGFGKVIQRLSDSPDRAIPICPLFLECGGCQLMHLSPSAQNTYKHNLVKDALLRNGGINVDVKPLLAMENPLYYRNKVVIPVKHQPFESGFFRENSHTIVDMDHCYLMSPLLNEIYLKIKEFLKTNNCTPVKNIILRHGFNTNQIMVALEVDNQISHQKEFVDMLTKFDVVKSILLKFNQQITTLYGNDYIEEIINGFHFKVSLDSFFQVNPFQTEILYSKAIELANLKSTDRVLDLYSGVGTIGIIMANHVHEVISVEIVKDAVRDAKENALLNKINNIQFINEDATSFVNRYNEQIDVLMVDPPRKGLTKQGITDILKLRPHRIVYISCNPMTLARDLKELTHDYNIEVVQPVDMFGQTVHVECIVSLFRV